MAMGTTMLADAVFDVISDERGREAGEEDGERQRAGATGTHGRDGLADAGGEPRRERQRTRAPGRRRTGRSCPSRCAPPPPRTS
ncbi:MAG: hypothetical protein MZV64_73560 [Ignavibacteriales bacterium]|nr:hypothetical protein [Ignavibacteriales bacterium]